MTGLEQQTIADVRAPAGTPPTDPELALVEREDLTDADDHSVRVDTSVRDLSDVVTQIGKDVVAAQESARYIATLENWACVLDQMSDNVSMEAQVATELLLNLTTAPAGLKSTDIIPSMEDLASNVRSAGQLRVYAKKLLEALLRLLEKIAGLFRKFITIITSTVASTRLKIVAAKASMLRAKGGRITKPRIDIGSVADFTAIRGIAVINAGELINAIQDIYDLVDATANGHLHSVLDCGKELLRIVTSESFPNPRATQARIGRAFELVEKSTLATLCNKNVGSDTRFTNADFVTTASVGMLGNKTIFRTVPKDNTAGEDNITYEFTDTRLIGQRGEYVPASRLFDTVRLSQCETLLALCEKGCRLLESISKSTVQNSLTSTVQEIHRAMSRRSKDGTLTGQTADAVQGAITAFSDACANPMRDIFTHLVDAMNAAVTIVSLSAKAHD